MAAATVLTAVFSLGVLNPCAGTGAEPGVWEVLAGLLAVAVAAFDAWTAWREWQRAARAEILAKKLS
jgi:hypothetical protein